MQRILEAVARIHAVRTVVKSVNTGQQAQNTQRTSIKRTTRFSQITRKWHETSFAALQNEHLTVNENHVQRSGSKKTSMVMNTVPNRQNFCEQQNRSIIAAEALKGIYAEAV